MRYLLTCHPGSGHVYPIVALGRALKDAGEQVVVATGNAYRMQVESADLTFFAAGPDWNESDIVPPEEVGLMWVNSPPRFSRDLLRIAREWKPHAIVREESEMAGWIVADALDLPHAALSLGLVGRADIFPLEFRGIWNEVRLKSGAFDDPHASSLHRYLYLDQFPAGWAAPAERPNGVTHSVGAALDYPVGSEQRSSRSDGKPHVYCTFGTVYNRQPKLLTTLLQSLSALDVEATVSVGPNVEPSGISSGSNVRIENFVNQFEVLAKSVAVVCHGGMGTVLATLVSGLPFVAIPLGANQNRVAKYATESGTALTIVTGERYVDAESLNHQQITSALKEVLDNPRYRQRAEQVGKELRESWQAGIAVRLLRELAETGKPVLSRDSGTSLT